MNEDLYDGGFENFERILTYDIEDGSTEKLVKSLRRLQAHIANIPPSQIRSMWLYDRTDAGPRFSMLYWYIDEDEVDEKFETLKIESNIKDFGELQRLQLKCRTERSDGDLAKLLDIVIKEIEKNKWSTLVELSFSNISGDILNEEVDFRLYFTKAK